MAQVLASHLPAGWATGLVNASYTMNQIIHNTTWVPGHFHMTVGSAVTMSFMGIAYWFDPVPHREELVGRRIALAHPDLLRGCADLRPGDDPGGLNGNAPAYRTPWMPRLQALLGSWRIINSGVGNHMLVAGIYSRGPAGTVFFGKKTTGQDAPHRNLQAPATERWQARLDSLPPW